MGKRKGKDISITVSVDRRFAALVLVVLLASIGGYVLALSPTFNTIIQPGSLLQPCTYIVFGDGTNYFSRNCQTGAIVYTGSNAITVIQSTVAAAAGSTTVYDATTTASASIAFSGTFTLTSPLDLTRVHGMLLQGVSDGKPFNLPYRPRAAAFTISHTGIGFDLTGSQGIQIKNLMFVNATNVNPTAFFLLARESNGNSAGTHTFEDDSFYGTASIAVIYNYGSEQVWFNRVMFSTAKQAMIITNRNTFSVTSPFRTIATGSYSMNENYFVQCVFDRPSVFSPTLASVTLDGTSEVRFFQTFFSSPNLYAVNITKIGRIFMVTFDQDHVEQGGLITAEAPTGIIYQTGITITNTRFTNINIPNGGSVIDLNYNNFDARQLVIEGNIFTAAMSLNFWVLEDFWIRLNRDGQPTLVVAGSSNHGTVDVFDGSLVSNNNRNGVTTIFGNCPGACNSYQGSVAFTANTTNVAAHRLITTPTFVSGSLSNQACGAWKWSSTATTITFTVATSCTGTLYWYAIVYT